MSSYEFCFEKKIKNKNKNEVKNNLCLVPRSIMKVKTMFFLKDKYHLF